MKRKTIILITILILLCGSITAFAAFMFGSKIMGSTETGRILVNEQGFLDYSLTEEEKNQYPDLSELEKLELRSNNPRFIDYKVSNSIEAYATKRKGYNDEENFIYLNQLGFRFSFTPEVDSYVRIHFEDAWRSKKTYTNGNISESYITKDKLNGKSPFEILDNNWVYDNATSCLYLKGAVSKSSEAISYDFNINEDYTYTSPIVSNNFREQIIVQVSYFVDIVQANRAEEIWGVSLDEIFKEEAQ